MHLPKWLVHAEHDVATFKVNYPYLNPIDIGFVCGGLSYIFQDLLIKYISIS